jgi:hypothetical protein
MFNQEIYASAFGRAVTLMRERRGDRDQQKAALRALVALAELSAASFRLYEGVLSVDDVAMPETVPFLDTLVGRLQAHRVSELMIGRQSEPAELLALIRGLAADPGTGPSIKERLRDVASKRVMVVLEQADSGERRAPSVTQAFEQAAIEEATAAADAAAAGTSGGAPADRDALAPEEAELLRDWDTFASGERVLPDLHVVLTPQPEAPGATAGAAEGTDSVTPGEAAEAAPQVPVPTDTPLGAALASIVMDPYGRTILDRLTELAARVQDALREDQTDAALRALAIMIDLEPGAPEGTPRNSYSIVLKRSLTREVLAQVAQCLLNPAMMDPAAKVMRRSRGDGVEVLLGLLATAEGMRERKAFMAVLRTMEGGTDQVVHMLGHQQWFVARNVAELVGEMRIEEAVDELGRLLGHADQRVRRAAAVSLARIGSVSTVEPLRRALKEGAPEVRSLIAASIGGQHARPLAMPLVALAETEENQDVQREYYRALGRIGTPEAIQALAKAAQPGGKLLGRRPAAARMGAIEGLRLAGGAAASALESLADDGDKTVREAARRALDELRTRA